MYIAVYITRCVQSDQSVHGRGALSVQRRRSQGNSSSHHSLTERITAGRRQPQRSATLQQYTMWNMPPIDRAVQSFCCSVQYACVLVVFIHFVGVYTFLGDFRDGVPAPRGTSKCALLPSSTTDFARASLCLLTLHIPVTN